MYTQTLSRALRASSLRTNAWFISSRIRARMGALSSKPSSYPQAFRAEAIRKSCSDVTTETVGPAGSTSDGAFSCCMVLGGATAEDEEDCCCELAGDCAVTGTTHRGAQASAAERRNGSDM